MPLKPHRRILPCDSHRTFGCATATAGTSTSNALSTANLVCFIGKPPRQFAVRRTCQVLQAQRRISRLEAERNTSPSLGLRSAFRPLLPDVGADHRPTL